MTLALSAVEFVTLISTDTVPPVLFVQVSWWSSHDPEAVIVLVALVAAVVAS